MKKLHDYLQTNKNRIKKIKEQLEKQIKKGVKYTEPLENDASPPVNKITRIGLWTIIIFFGGFLLWSTIFPLDSGAVMRGTIVVDTYRKSIQHLEGGIVKKIYVQEGSSVKAGDLLLLLDDAQAKANYSIWQEQVYFLEAKKARLIAESQNKDTIEFPPELIQAQNQIKAKTAMAGEATIFQAREDLLQKTYSILDDKIQQIKAEIESLKAQAASADQQLSLINQEIDATSGLVEKHIIPVPKLLALKRAQAELTGNRDENLALIAQSEQKIGEVKLQKIQLEQQQQQKIVEDLQTTLSDLASAEQKLAAAQDVWNRTRIMAPISGLVVNLQTHTIGGVIDPGATLMTIVPTQDKLVVDAKASPLDIDVLHPGLKAKIQFIALPRRSTPILNGLVTEVSADALTDEHTGNSYYTVRVTISPKELARLGTTNIYPGMPVEVLVIREKKTLFGYFLEPLENSFFKAFRES